MDLVINSYGGYLNKNGDLFAVKVNEQKFEVSCKKVERIMITTSATITTDAIKLAMDHNIDIIFLDDFGNPYARVWHPKLGSTVLIRRRQLEAGIGQAGIDFSKEWVSVKLSNCIEFLEKLEKTRKEKSDEIIEYCGKLSDSLERIHDTNGTLNKIRQKIMAAEAVGAKAYFEALSFLIPERFKFDGRSKNPAKDEFNCMLNYAYGVLYGLVEKSCIIAGLDPYVGFLHTDNYNKKSLVFDIIEMFRIFADETVFFMFSGRRVKLEYFDVIPNGLILNKEGKAALIGELNKYLDDSIRHRNRNISRRLSIQFECHHIAQKLLNLKSIFEEEDTEENMNTDS